MSTTAHAVLPCDELDPTVAFFTELGFRVDAVFPADDPAVTRLSGHGLGIELRRGPGDPGRLRVCLDGVDEVAEQVAPNGTVVELAPLLAPLHVPHLRSDLVVTHAADGASWVVGRAGMRYRDLLPGRLGGRFIASHIHLPDGGPVPDYVHYHHIRFQMIFVARGWVRLVYEDQGEPFVLQAGDCVLQPPLIRHRVLESSPHLEVIEIGCPAEHETLVEHEFDLPTPVIRRDRDFSGQRFVRHTAATAPRMAWRGAGFRARDTGIAAATDGLADARVVEGSAGARAVITHTGELWFAFVLDGAASLDVDGTRHDLVRDDAVSVPPGAAAELSVGDHAEVLVVSLPVDQH
jgi:mannose-6-phosphate isomerase-like protein (cupin superfamily)